MHIPAQEGLEKLGHSGKLFLELFHHGTLVIEMYKPDRQDPQQPHDRDEVYIIISGHGDFISNQDKVSFKPGDFLFVAAREHHHFENFSEDFVTWVIFYGPKGGEAEIPASLHV